MFFITKSEISCLDAACMFFINISFFINKSTSSYVSNLRGLLFIANIIYGDIVETLKPYY